jgi:IS5 family transposase
MQDGGHRVRLRSSWLIEQATFTSIIVHDHHAFEKLIATQTKAVHADKAHGSEEHRESLKHHNKRNGILCTGCRHRIISPKEKERNNTLSRTRSAIEVKINDLKQWCHLQRLGYFITCGRNLIQVVCARSEPA